MVAQLTQGSAVAPLEVASVFTSWRADPVGIVVSVLIAVGYLLQVRQVRARGERWPVGRTVFLFAGLVSLLLITCSFLGVYASQLRWVAVLQAGLVLLMVPPLIGLGGPVALWQRWRARPGTAPSVGPDGGFVDPDRGSAGAGHEGQAGRPAGAGTTSSIVLRILQAPGIGPLAIIATTSLLVFTPWLSWSMSGAPARTVTLLLLLGAGLVLALPVTDVGAEASSLAYAAMLALGLLEFLLDAVPGMVLRLSSHVIGAGHWTALDRGWGPSALSDQKLSGDWLWFLAEAGDLPYLLILITAWIRSDARDAARQDAELDLVETDADGMMRPWWHDQQR